MFLEGSPSLDIAYLRKTLWSSRKDDDFLGKHRIGRWIGAGLRFCLDEDVVGSYNKGGISFGLVESKPIVGLYLKSLFICKLMLI